MMLKRTAYICLFSLLICSAHAFQDNSTTLLKKLTGEEAITGTTKLTERFTQLNREVAANYLLSQSQSFAGDAKIVEYSKTGRNVVVEIKATTKSDEWVVLGAHYDSVRDCPGANDNASGVAAMYDVARHLAGLENRIRNVYVVFFDEEEKGLVGSRNFARWLKDNDVNVHSAHTIDQMGWDNDGDKGIELEMPHDELLAHYKAVAKSGGFKAPIHTTKVTSTDHTAFREQGYKAVGITEEYKNRDTTPHYHKSSDTFETLDLDYLKSTTDYLIKVYEALITKKNI